MTTSENAGHHEVTLWKSPHKPGLYNAEKSKVTNQDGSQ